MLASSNFNREANHASQLLAALKVVVRAHDGEADAAFVLNAIATVLPFDRAAVIAVGEGGSAIMAAVPAATGSGTWDHVDLAGLKSILHVPSGGNKVAAGLEGVATEGDEVLSVPLSIDKKFVVAILVRSGAERPFDSDEIAMARVLSTSSLAQLVGHLASTSDRAGVWGYVGADSQEHLLFKVILDHLPISLTVQDSSGTFVLANAMAAADLAVSVERLVGSTPADFLSVGDAISRREWERSVIAGGKTITAETKVQDAEGDRVLLTSHTPVSITNNTLLISSSVDITKHREVERELSERALIDKLTGLPDRVRIQRHAEEIIQNQGTPFALAFIDLDNFKHVNDYYNHAVGDALLLKIAERIKKRLKPADMLARISGDEFLLLLNGVDCQESAGIAIEEVLSDLKQPFYIEGFEIFTSGSIGVSFYPAHGKDYETLRRNADGAMYGAKGRAKGQAVYFDDGLGKKLAARMESEQRLRLAIRDHRFVCAFQPKVDIHTQEVTGFETLVRWRDSDGEIHMPGQFISLAIELGLINPITSFVLSETFASMDRLDAAFGAGKSVSINIGAKQTSDVSFMRTLLETIKKSPHAGRLILELTEDAIIEKGVFQTEILPHLRELGVKISIDDFGTGYSSLSALADITADEIKIDRSFITRIHERPRSQSVLRAVESLAKSLDMTMVAEGVETAEELIYLQTASRIRLAQGYYFAKPIYLDEMNSGVVIGSRAGDVRATTIQDRISGRLRAPAPSRGR